ncbi:MAG: T9SS type A sorting domain-containing protein [Catalinimonas sp.]
MSNRLLLLCLFLLSAAALRAQSTVLRQVIVLNGGAFGTDFTAVVGTYDPETSSADTLDRIGTTSIQNLLVRGDDLYVLAADSIVRYDLATRTRVAATAFGGVSTLSAAYYPAGDQLLVGNWFGRTDSSLYVYDAQTLALDYVVAEIGPNVADIMVVGDSAYVAQNQTSSSFSDTAGTLAVVDLAERTFVRSVALANEGNNVSRVYLRGDSLLVVGADGLGYYRPATGSYTHHPLAAPIVTTYGSVMQLVGDTLFAIDAATTTIGALRADDGAVIEAAIVDTTLSRFVYDTLAGRFYVTYSDFVTRTHEGYVYDRTGDFLRVMPVGISPEALALDYETVTSARSPRTISLHLYPNPAATVVRWDTPARAVRLYDARGRQRRVVLHDARALDVSTCAPGVYWLEVETSEALLRGRVVVRP